MSDDEHGTDLHQIEGLRHLLPVEMLRRGILANDPKFTPEQREQRERYNQVIEARNARMAATEKEGLVGFSASEKPDLSPFSGAEQETATAKGDEMAEKKTDEEKKAAKAAYMKAYLARRKAEKGIPRQARNDNKGPVAKVPVKRKYHRKAKSPLVHPVERGTAPKPFAPFESYLDAMGEGNKVILGTFVAAAKAEPQHRDLFALEAGRKFLEVFGA